MIQSNYTVVVLQPSEGYTITQSADVEVQDRILSKKVFLAVNDSPSNWKEITDAEAEEVRVAQEEYVKGQKELQKEDRE